MSDDCAYPDLSPSYGYKLGCRCADRCAAWRRAKDLEYRDRLNAYKRAKRRSHCPLCADVEDAFVRDEAKTSGRSATTFYNDVLDWWGGL